MLLNEGWSICAVNSRGCAGSMITSEVLHNSRATWDFRPVVTWFKLKFLNRPLFGLGFSPLVLTCLRMQETQPYRKMPMKLKYELCIALRRGGREASFEDCSCLFQTLQLGGG
jgi:hypothetical protein